LSKGWNIQEFSFGDTPVGDEITEYRCTDNIFALGDLEIVCILPQSRQSAKLFLQKGGGGRGVGGVPIPTRGHTLWCSILVHI
jgi:hypothetical protein